MEKIIETQTIFAPDEPRVTMSGRKFVIPPVLRVVGVECDHHVHHILFEIPRYAADDNDLSTFDIYINYINANEQGNCYACKNVTVTQNDTLIFEWLISNFINAAAGEVSFSIEAHNNDGRVWNSTIGKLVVLDGISTQECIDPDNEAGFVTKDTNDLLNYYNKEEMDAILKKQADYDLLQNKPKINGTELDGNKSFEDIGLDRISNTEIEGIF